MAEYKFILAISLFQGYMSSLSMKAVAYINLDGIVTGIYWMETFLYLFSVQVSSYASS